MPFSCGLEKEEACPTEKDRQGEGGSDMKNEDAENEKCEKHAAENEARILFAEDDWKSDDVILLIPGDILKILERERGGVGDEEEEEEHRWQTGKIVLRSDDEKSD